MSNKRNRKRRPQPATTRPADRDLELEATDASDETDVIADGAERPSRTRRSTGLAGSMFATGPSAMPPMGRSIGRGMIAVACQPVLVVLTIAIVTVTWFGLLALGFEGAPGRLVDLLALPPISTFFDLGTGNALYGIGPAFLVFIGVAIAIRSVVYSMLTGLVLESLIDGRVSTYGVLQGLRALPTMLAVNVLSFSIIVASNLILPILGGGIGFLGFVAALVAGLFFLGFAPTASIREGRPVIEEIRRSGRAAMLPNSRHLVLCSLYFFLSLPLLLGGFAPGGASLTANPTVATWAFAFAANVVHLGFLAAFAYRWLVAEPEVPEQPVKRRPSAKAAPSRRSRSR